MAQEKTLGIATRWAVWVGGDWYEVDGAGMTANGGRITINGEYSEGHFRSSFSNLGATKFHLSTHKANSEIHTFNQKYLKDHPIVKSMLQTSSYGCGGAFSLPKIESAVGTCADGLGSF